MRTRSITTFVALAALALTACGGGGGSEALSEDDFVDALSDVCDDASGDLDDLDFPTDGDFADFSDDVSKIFETTIEDAKAIEPPEDLAKDYEDFIANLEDQLDLAGDLGKADDDEAAFKVLDKLTKLSDEQSEIAQDLDVEACDPNADDDDTDTTDSTDTTESAADTTAAPTVPPTTAAPITLPATVPPTAPPATLPPATQPPVSGDLWTVVDLTTIFNAPAGFTLVDYSPTEGTLDAIRSLPELNTDLLEFGVATLVDPSDGTEIADIWVGVSRDDSMPADWKTLDCPNGGDLRTSGDGIPGIVCYGAADSPTWEIFTATVGDYGISVYTLVPEVPGDLVADAFLEANPG